MVLFAGVVVLSAGAVELLHRFDDIVIFRFKERKKTEDGKN